MAVCAQTRRHGVTPRKWEAGTAVIEDSIRPRTRVVALIASLWKAGRDMIGVGSPLIVLQMTRHAGRARQGVVIAHMAVDALTRWNRVQAGQGKPRAVVIEGRICP